MTDIEELKRIYRIYGSYKEPSYQLYAEKAIQYIWVIPKKTDGTLLIDSYGCTPETADIEFEWTRKKAKDNGKESHLARHFIQAFERAKQRRNRLTKSERN